MSGDEETRIDCLHQPVRFSQAPSVRKGEVVETTEKTEKRGGRKGDRREKREEREEKRETTWIRKKPESELRLMQAKDGSWHLVFSFSWLARGS